MANIFGNKWSFTSFGESHGVAVGGVLDGVPSGISIDLNLIRQELDRRAGRGKNGVKTGSIPGQYLVSNRAINEPDEVEWLSGVMDGVTLGTPIAFMIRNTDARPQDYEFLKHSYRVGHADRVYEQKYGIRDYRGGGRASARETAARVVAGCLAKQELASQGVRINAQLIQVGAETNPDKFSEIIAHYKQAGDSIGGIIECHISGLSVGTGEPVFDKLQAHLAFAVMSINACKGFEYGTGFAGVTQPGSAINHISGGISGGIADGSEITFRCVFKPTPSTPLAGVKGRHDACIAVRAVPVVEAMTALALVQFL